VSKTAPAPYAGPASPSGKPLIEQLQWAIPDVNRDVVWTIGECEDATGQLKDAEQLRYSRAVTQACRVLLQSYAKMSGLRVVERNPVNLGIIAQEYQMSHSFATTKPGDAPVNVGLIGRGGPEGRLQGAKYLLTGAITSYSTSVETGGGGLDVDGIGGSVRRTKAEVTVVLSIVDMSTSEVVSSLSLTSSVVGTTKSFHVTRFLGGVASLVATVTGANAASTILRPTNDAHVVSAEFGGGQQLPIDYAVTDALVANLAHQLEMNWQLYYTKPVKFDYGVAGK
jgi:curli biogenesis system outer membrane secretion channel CsgG